MAKEFRIKSGRFTLRPLSAEHGDQVVALLDDIEVSRWLTVVPHPYSRADFDGFLSHLAKAPPIGGLAITDGAEVLGVIGIDPTLGYWLGRRYQGRGVMRQAANALVDHVFRTTDLDQISSGHFPGNHGSRAVLTGLGFQDTGVIEGTFCQSRNCPEKLIKLRLTRDDWEAAQ